MKTAENETIWVYPNTGTQISVISGAFYADLR